jgi:hypothetical protein
LVSEVAVCGEIITRVFGKAESFVDRLRNGKALGGICCM